jgi:hypothetical protein
MHLFLYATERRRGCEAGVNIYASCPTNERTEDCTNEFSPTALFLPNGYDDLVLKLEEQI